MDYKDDEKYKYLNQKEFENLVVFIHEFTGDADSADALDFMKIGYRRNVGEVVSIKNYVGLIQMKNGFQIQVLPKISFGEEDEGNVQTKRVFLRMLRSMKDFPSKVFNDASLKVDQMNLYELFINMYLQEILYWPSYSPSSNLPLSSFKLSSILSTSIKCKFTVVPSPLSNWIG